MSQYVLILSIGPVQGFIASARRSRDLWCGSWLLSEMSKAAARVLDEQGAALIFPYTKNPEVDLKAASSFSVGNKIQAVITAHDQAEISELAKQAKQAAKAVFVDEALKAKKAVDPNDLRHEIWNAQIDDYVEAQAAWAGFDPQDENGYHNASQLAAKILAARKATRDFAPLATAADQDGHMIPKSSLDGARETVLMEDKELRNVTQRKLSLPTRRKLGLSSSEQLDCAGVTKRQGGRIDQFTPFSRIAAHAWINKLSEQEQSSITKAYEPLIEQQLATRVSGNEGIYAGLPFDAQYCYRPRLEAAIRDSLTAHDQPGVEALQHLMNALKPIWQKHGQPCAYGVLLLADGDRMGELLDKATKIEEHQAITQALSAFAGSVAGIVRKHEGHCIYAGGDDVLAMVPLNQAQSCAKALADDFKQKLNEVAGNLKVPADKRPTLSVGLGIAHIMEPLGTIRALADQAEKAAKGNSFPVELQRNALAITLAVRSGSTTTVRMRWTDDEGLKAFENWKAAYEQKAIPSRVAYDTREVAQRTRFALTGKDQQPGIVEAEFRRMLARARTCGGEKLTGDNRKLLEGRIGQLGHDKLDQLADELIVARWLAAKTQRDLGR